MNRPSSIYRPSTRNATHSGTFVGSDFNAKEKDYESGFHYYGARYYDSEVLTGWLSVDPMADKYLSISLYNYCMWNPVRLVDPDGKCADDPPTNLIYPIQKGDNFWELEKQWNLPHGTLQSINPNIDPNNLQVGQEINAAKMDGNFIIVGNNVSIPENREFVESTEEGPFGLVTTVSSDGFLPFGMAFDALLPNSGAELSNNFRQIGRSLTKLSSRNISWTLGRNHSAIKWNNEMKKRGWTDNRITETIRKGKSFSAQNKVHPSNKATRYENKNTRKSIVVDRKTREVIHVGGSDFKY